MRCFLFGLNAINNDFCIHTKIKQMFTIEQIKAAHAKVKSGADYPNYVKDIILLGVTHYDNFVADGHAVFYGGNSQAEWTAKYEPLEVAATCNKEQFITDLKAHQQGKTNYPTFCSDCARSGIEKWIVKLDKMTCTYYDKAGNEVLQEIIPTT